MDIEDDHSQKAVNLSAQVFNEHKIMVKKQKKNFTEVTEKFINLQKKY